MNSTISLRESPVVEQGLIRTLINTSSLLIVVVVSAWIFSAPLREAARIMPYVQDDFYYYLKVAQNVAHGQDSTFNGIIRTNGYHPLYFVVLVLVCKIASSLEGIFRVLWLLWIAATAATFLLARKLLERPGTGPLLANALALIFLIPCIHIFCEGMEVTLTLPLGVGLLLAFRSRPADWTFGRSVGIGLLAALTVLSRLDSVFLVLLLLFFTLAEREQRRGIEPRQLAGFTLGGAPLLIAYFLFNHFYFHTWMPVSGAAKQLKSSPWPTLTGIESGGLNTEFLGVFVVYAAVAFWLTRNKLAPGERPILAAAVAFPYVHLGVLSVLSDWPLWGWYFYSLRIAMLAGIVLLLAIPGSAWVSRQAIWIKAAAYAVALVLFLRVHWKKDIYMEPIYEVAVQLQAFDASHPGIYAMGGGAGMAGYLMHNPIIQTEGLMMDPAYLQHIRRQDDLLTTLRGYGVRYYIDWEPAGLEKPRQGQCFTALEPDDPTGPVTLHMRSVLCGPPLATFPAWKVVASVYDVSQK